MRKIELWIISFSLTGCAGLPWVPKAPAVTQYGIHADIDPPGFYGRRTDSKERVFRELNDPAMKAGQCLSADDYKAMQGWVAETRKLAEEHCK